MSRRERMVYGAIAVLAAVSAWRLGLLDAAHIAKGSANLARFAGDLMPPHLPVLPELAAAMLETIEISFLGTLLGFAMSLPLAALSVHGLFPAPSVAFTRSFIGAVRSVPSILYGVIFVVAFGLGSTAGVFAVAFYTLGYLAKLYYEAFEAVDIEVLEAVRSTGARPAQLFFFAILPESANAILSQLLFMFEYNIRASTIMGFVGAGGIGYYMLGYVQMLQYRQLSMAILLTFVVVMAIDFLSLRLREAVAEAS